MVDLTVVDLALQGGGAHGAFTWGVLDRLLEEERIGLGAISGASAGAMNAAVMADGWLADGRVGAQRALWTFWKRVSRAAHSYTLRRSPFGWMFDPWRIPQPPWGVFAETLARYLSPYQLNPLNWNPIIEILNDLIDFERLRRAAHPRLFISATNVRTDGMRIFRNPELSGAVLMASACLPHIFQAVTIDGEHYWDGGYVANPALLPLINESAPHDLIIVQLNPSVRPEIPRSAAAIIGRLNEITFNASLMKELRSVALLQAALREEAVGSTFRHPLFEQVNRLLVHRIAADAEALRVDGKSKLYPEWEFLIHLHGLGRKAADDWLSRHFDDLHRRSTVDLASFTV